MTSFYIHVQDPRGTSVTWHIAQGQTIDVLTSRLAVRFNMEISDFYLVHRCRQLTSMKDLVKGDNVRIVARVKGGMAIPEESKAQQTPTSANAPGWKPRILTGQGWRNEWETADMIPFDMPWILKHIEELGGLPQRTKGKLIKD